VWHQKHRERGEVPHTSIDTEAHGLIAHRHDTTRLELYGQRTNRACSYGERHCLRLILVYVSKSCYAPFGRDGIQKHGQAAYSSKHERRFPSCLKTHRNSLAMPIR
jgi:hypothetical protein